MEDSGQYKVQNTDGQNTDAVYQLTMYGRSSVHTSSVQQEQDETHLQCSVLCGEWERGQSVLAERGETLFYTSSSDSNSSILFVLLVIEGNSTSYSCVATNPASNKTVTVRPEEFCFDNHSSGAVVNVVLVLRLVEFVLVTLAVLLLIRLYREGRVLTQHQHSTERRGRRSKGTDIEL
ncbi:hypothetical protein AGOR_G00194780 [Albula goreensis]|uniref:Ig-like domain-containing protein n=1 Tax=Albula goreensis TaxID=1534307 RepID=A0A8T3CRP4_9TELE|nr:hypothetical protein AGOR_G00194780 [Albula goreensis]